MEDLKIISLFLKEKITNFYRSLIKFLYDNKIASNIVLSIFIFASTYSIIVKNETNNYIELFGVGIMLGILAFIILFMVCIFLIIILCIICQGILDLYKCIKNSYIDFKKKYKKNIQDNDGVYV
jgi:hypothetical protein